MDTTKIEIRKDSIFSNSSKVFHLTTIETRQNQEPTTIWSDFCNCQQISNLIWPLTTLLIIFLFYRQLKNVLDNIIKRLKEGSSFSFGAGGIAVGETVKGTTTMDQTASQPKSSAESFERSEDVQVSENETSRKILSTLWYHQNAMDNSFKRRWTFRVTSSSDFDLAASILQSLGLISVVYDTNQYVLTDTGINYCRDHAGELGDFSYFPRT